MRKRTPVPMPTAMRKRGAMRKRRLTTAVRKLRGLRGEEAEENG
jgi:hypothetical protein